MISVEHGVPGVGYICLPDEVEEGGQDFMVDQVL